LKDYSLDCKITKFLEENLAWTNNKEGMDFCAYTLLGEKDDKIYLKAFCEEFYVSREKKVCPDEKSLNDCFISKTKEGCSACKNETIEPRIVSGSGVSIPVRLTKSGDSYILWTPRDGSLYDKDIKAEFPSDIISLLSNTKRNLESISVERAEIYFNTNAVFNSKKILDQSCQYSVDCGEVPGEFAVLSNCPHTMKCIAQKCNVGCYDFIDYKEMPILEK
jgi:hypothetical protein